MTGLGGHIYKYEAQASELSEASVHSLAFRGCIAKLCNGTELKKIVLIFGEVLGNQLVGERLAVHNFCRTGV